MIWRLQCVKESFKIFGNLNFKTGVFNVAPAKVVLKIKRGDEIWRLSSVDFFILLTVKILLFFYVIQDS